MDPVLTPSAQLWKVNNYLVPKAVEGLSREDLLTRASEHSSPILWILAHITKSRCGVLKMLGVEQEFPWSEEFGRGSQVGPAESFPELDELMGVFNSATESMMKRLEEASDEELSQPAARNFPVDDKTVRGAINFLAFHEGYHVGQMAFIRKWLGKESLVG